MHYGEFHANSLSLPARLFGVEWSISQCQTCRETRALQDKSGASFSHVSLIFSQLGASIKYIYYTTEKGKSHEKAYKERQVLCSKIFIN